MGSTNLMAIRVACLESPDESWKVVKSGTIVFFELGTGRLEELFEDCK